MDRLKTYVEGFDEALDGGIPRGSLVLVAGTPGTMKTALTFSILYENVKAGSKALYITLEESQEDLRAAMTDLGMTGLDDMELYILDVGRIRLEHKDEEPTKNWLDVLQKYIDQRVRVNTFDLIALDSLAALYSLSHLNNPRRELFHFFGFLKSLHATCFLISAPVFTSTSTPPLRGPRRNGAPTDAPSPVTTTSRPTGRCRTSVPFPRRSDSRRIISATSGWSRYAVSPAFARTSRPFRRITSAIAFDSLCPAASSDQNAAWRDRARSRRRRADIAARSWLRTSSFSVASTSFASLGWRRCRNVWNSWLKASSSGGERGRDGATGAGISPGGSFVDRSLADKAGTSCSIRSTASAKLLSGWRSIASMTTLPWPSSSQRSSFRAASSRLALPSRRAQRTAATKAFLPKSGFEEYFSPMKNLHESSVYILDMGQLRRGLARSESSKDWFTILFEIIKEAVSASGYGVLALDSLEALYALSEIKTPRREMFHFLSSIKELGLTTFLIAEQPFRSARLAQCGEDFLADGILNLRQAQHGETDVQLRLRCIKMRWMNHDHNALALNHDGQKFFVTHVISKKK